MKQNHWTTIDKLESEKFNRQAQEHQEFEDKQHCCQKEQHAGADHVDETLNCNQDNCLHQQQEQHYTKLSQNDHHSQNDDDDPTTIIIDNHHLLNLTNNNNHNIDNLNRHRHHHQPPPPPLYQQQPPEPQNGDEDDDNSDDIEALKLLDKRLLARQQPDYGHDSKKFKSCEDTQVKLQKKKRNLNDINNVNLSFCGCGFLGIYHVGVTSCFHEYAPQLSQHKISGSSAGALVAVAHICGNLSLAYCTTDILTVAIEARSHTLGPFHPSFDVQASVREALMRGLPEDAYERANGRLHVSLTRVQDGENVIISQFESKEDLIQVLLCSCFIPFWSGLRLPKYKGVAYIDGGFSNNLLILDDNTVTVSPFSGEADICPQDDTLNLLQLSISNTSFSVSPNNLYRLSHALLPPAPETLSELFEQGFADGIRYLQKMNLISCTKCVEIRSSLLVTTSGEDMEDVISHGHAAATSGAANELNDSSKIITSGDEMSAMHLIVLEQQEQKMIEINRNSRRSSFVSTTSQFHHHLETAPAVQSITTSTTSDSSATSSISIQNILNVGMNEHDLVEVGDGCGECSLIRQKALYGQMPRHFRDRIREACESVEKSLYNWLCSHRPLKYLSYLMIPYYLPIDLTLAVIYAGWKRLPAIQSELLDCLVQVVNFIVKVIAPNQGRSISSILMGPDCSSAWRTDETNKSGKEPSKQQQQDSGTKVHHHHHHHHLHHHPSHYPSHSAATAAPVSTVANAAASTSSLASLPTASVHHQQAKMRSKSVSSNISSNIGHGHQHRELHSLEDTFDNIVDVTSKQEARIFAYYFRDSKNRLQVTEIFDLQRAAELSNSNLSLNSTTSNNINTNK